MALGVEDSDNHRSPLTLKKRGNLLEPDENNMIAMGLDFGVRFPKSSYNSNFVIRPEQELQPLNQLMKQLAKKQN